MATTGRARRDDMTLATLLEAVGPDLLELVEGTGDAAATVRDSVIWDRADVLAPSAGGVLLLVGGEATSPEVLATIEVAARLGYAAVALKRRGADTTMAGAVAGSSIAVLVVADDASWASVDSLVASVIASHPEEQATLAIDHGDLFAIANAIALSVGAAVTIEDPGWHVLAYSSVEGHPIDAVRQDSILGRRVRRLDPYESEYRAIARSQEPVYFAPYDDVLARVAMPVRASGRLLGSIWAIDADDTRRDEIGVVLERAMPSVALHLLGAAHRGDLARYRRAELLSIQLGVRAPHGVDVSEGLRRLLPATLVAFGPLNRADGVIDDLRLTDAVAASAESLRYDASCARVANAIYVLLPAERVEAPQRRRFAASTLEVLEQLAGVPFGCALAEVASPDAVTAARADVDRTLRAMVRQERFAVLDVDADRHVTVLEELVEHGVASDANLVAPLRALLAHDAQTGSDYAATLLAHLDYGGDVRRAAAARFVHPNSHRYRMRKIVEHFGVDLEDPTARLVLWLQLRARDKGSETPR